MQMKYVVHGTSLLNCIAGTGSRADGWLTLTRKLTSKGTSPTKDFCTDR